jgi:hypothetical protein
MRKKLNLLLVALPVLFVLLGAGCSLDSAIDGDALGGSTPAHFAGDGIEASSDQRM